jgi:DNA polymerase I-like protein with 3'-5' exonuclease and polymerase domains
MKIIDTQTLDDRATALSDSENYWVYNGLDCCVTLEVFNVTRKQLDEVSRATYEMAMAVQAPVLEMVLEGMPVSLSRIRDIKTYYHEQLAELEGRWQRLCVEGLGLAADRKKRPGRTPVAINVASPKDVGELFYDILGVPVKKKRTKGSEESRETTERAALESFRDHFFAEPFVNYILAMRDTGKSIGFLNTKPDADSKFRCSFNVAGTKTGRLSSSFSDEGSGTNLQNVTGKLKDIFVAPPGWMFLDVDLEQGDSRGVGAIAWNLFRESHGEEFAGAYLDACESGDLHTTVCRMAWTDLAWGDDPAKWKPVAETPAYRELSYRDLAKRLGHGTNYLGQAPAMAAAAKLPVGLIKNFQTNYFNGFPCVKEWQNWTINELTTTRTLTSPWGRRRFFWKDPKAQSTINDAIAYSPQNTTGEFTNRGLLQLWYYANMKKLPIKFLLQVHDSLVFLVREEAIDDMVPLILEKLRVYLPLAGGRQFTIPHGCKTGWNYGKYDKKKNMNPYGLVDYKGRELREPPKRAMLADILNQPARS